MDVIAAYRDVGSYRGAAEICGTSHKTVKRIVEAHEVGQRPGRRSRPRNFEGVADLVAERVKATAGRISAKRLLPRARAAGYGGSARNFRRLVARVKVEWRQSQHRGRRPGVWAPGETLPRPAGQALILTLPSVPTRSLQAYRIGGEQP
jgi:hypothetical protein